MPRCRVPDNNPRGKSPYDNHPAATDQVHFMLVRANDLQLASLGGRPWLCPPVDLLIVSLSVGPRLHDLPGPGWPDLADFGRIREVGASRCLIYGLSRPVRRFAFLAWPRDVRDGHRLPKPAPI
jgi:hypothetical protein